MEENIIQFTKEIAGENPILAYVFFFISAVLQILFPPYPGDTVLVLEGYLASKGFFNTYLIALNAITGTFLSCLSLYHVSYRLGDRIFESAFINKFFSRDKIDRLTEWFKKYGSAAILISKFVPGIGSLTMIVAGTFRVPKLKAYAAMVAASVMHNSLLVLIGKTAGDNVALIKEIFAKYNLIIIAVVLVSAGLYWYMKSYLKSREYKKASKERKS